MRKLEQHSWPGNVRELQNVIQRSAVISEGTLILPGAISLAGGQDDGPASGATTYGEARAMALRTFEREYVTRMLLQHDGNITHAARAANKERRAFGRLVKKHGLTAAAGR